MRGAGLPTLTLCRGVSDVAARRLACELDVMVVPSESPEVDETLIDEMLKLSPEQRLELHDQMLETALELRRGFAQVQQANHPAA